MARHKKLEAVEDEDPKLDISSLIDVCFLLLIYFIVATSLIQERKLDMSMPGQSMGENASQIEPALIRIIKDGTIYWGKDNSLMIAPALNYIEDNYMQQFTMKDLADLCHWSPTHFRRVFHDIMGTSPLDFVNNTRITKSCNLLRSTELSILDISEMVGFHSISSYNRYFTKVMQMSPREFRKQMLQSDKMTQNQSILEYAGWMYPE